MDSLASSTLREEQAKPTDPLEFDTTALSLSSAFAVICRSLEDVVIGGYAMFVESYPLSSNQGFRTD